MAASRPASPRFSAMADVLWTARYDYQPHSKLKRHRHDFFQMIYCVGGAGDFFLGHDRYSLDAGALFLIKPRRDHALSADTLVKTLDLKFVVNDPTLRRELLAAENMKIFSAGAVARLFEEIRTEGETRPHLYREMCNTLLLQILFQYLRADHRQTAVNARLEAEDHLPADQASRRALEFIHAHYAEDLTLESIAAAAGRSGRLVRELLHKSLGVPPMQYLPQYRVEKAKELIQYSDYALKEIAERVGFKTVHHFTRVFHQVAGETPGAWRRKYQGGICKDVCIDPHFSNINRTSPQ